MMIHRIFVTLLMLLLCLTDQCSDDSWPLDHSQTFVDTNRQAGILRVAALNGDLETLKFFIERLNVPVKLNDQELLLMAAIGSNLDLIRYLVNEVLLTTRASEKILPGDTALHKAVLGGNVEVVQFFIKTLHYKVESLNWNCVTPAAYAILSDNFAVFRYLVEEAGANYENAPPHGDHLIFSAVSYDRVAIVKYLVEVKRVDLRLKTQRRMTLLHSAVLGKSLKVLKYLIEDANMLPLIDEVDKYGKTAAMEAVFKGHLVIVKYLLNEVNASISGCTNEIYRRHRIIAANPGVRVLEAIAGIKCLRNTDEDKDDLVERSISTHSGTATGHNMLHLAVLGRHLPVVKYLVEEKGFNLSDRNADGRTVVELAEYQSSDKAMAGILEYLRKATTNSSRLQENAEKPEA